MNRRNFFKLLGVTLPAIKGVDLLKEKDTKSISNSTIRFFFNIGTNKRPIYKRVLCGIEHIELNTESIGNMDSIVGTLYCDQSLSDLLNSVHEGCEIFFHLKNDIEKMEGVIYFNELVCDMQFNGICQYSFRGWVKSKCK